MCLCSANSNEGEKKKKRGNLLTLPSSISVLKSNYSLLPRYRFSFSFATDLTGREGIVSLPFLKIDLFRQPRFCVSPWKAACDSILLLRADVSGMWCLLALDENTSMFAYLTHTASESGVTTKRRHSNPRWDSATLSSLSDADASWGRGPAELQLVLLLQLQKKKEERKGFSQHPQNKLLIEKLEVHVDSQSNRQVWGFKRATIPQAQHAKLSSKWSSFMGLKQKSLAKFMTQFMSVWAYK